MGKPDTLVGIAASGRTPYVMGAMEYAKSLGALTVGLSCVPGSTLAGAAEIAITPATGAGGADGEHADEGGDGDEDGIEYVVDGRDGADRRDVWQPDGEHAAGAMQNWWTAQRGLSPWLLDAMRRPRRSCWPSRETM